MSKRGSCYPGTHAFGEGWAGEIALNLQVSVTRSFSFESKLEIRQAQALRYF